jgi:Holliday junction resolvasome RuvABC ATP-dependent DNA helicase subunit
MEQEETKEGKREEIAIPRIQLPRISSGQLSISPKIPVAEQPIPNQSKVPKQAEVKQPESQESKSLGMKALMRLFIFSLFDTQASVARIVSHEVNAEPQTIPLFGKAQEVVVDTVQNVSKNATHGAVDTVLRPALIRAIHALADQLDPDHQGSEAMRLMANLWRAIAHQFRPPIYGLPGPDGQFPLLQAGGAGRVALEETLCMIRDQIRDRGNLDQIVQEVLQMMQRHMDAQMLAYVVSYIGRLKDQLNESIKIVGEQINVQLEAAEKKVEAVGQNVRVTGREVIENVREAETLYKRSLVYTVGAAGGMGALWYGSRVAWNRIEHKLSRPRLLLDSSRKGLIEAMKNYFWPQPLVLRPMVFSPDVWNELKDIVAVTKKVSQEAQAGKKNVEHINLLLWGPPGTGKSMFAEELAKKSGMDFAIMSGASFSKFTARDGIEAMDELFEWALKSRKGVVIFIDEAEAFLAKRDDIDINSSSYQLITNFLHHTGTGSNKFMVVLATNKLTMLDTAVQRRFFRKIKIDLPEKPERAKILRLYRDSVLLDKEFNTPEFITSARTSLNDEKVDSIAEQLKGFAPSELKDIINAIKVTAAITDSGLITEHLVTHVVEQALKEHRPGGSSTGAPGA